MLKFLFLPPPPPESVDFFYLICRYKRKKITLLSLLLSSKIPTFALLFKYIEPYFCPTFALLFHRRSLVSLYIKYRLTNNMILGHLPLTEFMMIVGNETYIKYKKMY